jgi:hypothetical protein
MTNTATTTGSYNITLIFAAGQDAASATFEAVVTAEPKNWAEKMAGHMGLKLQANPTGWTPAIIIHKNRR